MVNDFSSDSNCIALWRLEEDALEEDSKGANALSIHGVTSHIILMKEGEGSGVFDNSVPAYAEIADASLTSDFPFKSGTSNKAITVCFWMNAESHAAIGYMISKSDGTTPKWCFGVTLQVAGNIAVILGYNSGASYQMISLPAGTLTLTNGYWYHVAVSYDDSTRRCRIRVYDETADATYTLTATASNALSLVDAAWRLGDRADGSRPYDGLLDEVIVFNRELRLEEIDEIRAGTYDGPYSPTWSGSGNDFTGDEHCVALYRFEDGALTVDSIGDNELTAQNGPTADTVNYQEGAASAQLVAASSQYFNLGNVAMSADFPFRNGSSNTTMTFCLRFKLASIPANGEYYGLLCKWGLAIDANFHARLYSDGSQMYFRGGYLGDDGQPRNMEPGGSNTWTESARLDADTWYFIAVSIYGTGGWRVLIYDDEGAECLSAYGPGNPPDVGQSANLQIGRWNYYYGFETKYFDGLMDELVIFNDILFGHEIDEIRQGIYDGPWSSSSSSSSSSSLSSSSSFVPLAWPTLSKGLEVSVTEVPADKDIVTPLGCGRPKVRPKFTRRRRRWQCGIRYMTTADRLTLEKFYCIDCRRSLRTFEFTHPKLGQTWLVRFDPESPPRVWTEPRLPGKHGMEFVLLEDCAGSYGPGGYGALYYD